MDLVASILLDESALVRLIVTFQPLDPAKETTKYEGHVSSIKAGHYVIHQLNHMANGSFRIPHPEYEADDQLSYVLPVDDDSDVCALIKKAKRIENTFYIVSRDQWVTDEEYCAFFGSSGGMWEISTCDYPRGDFIETLRQTVYDMEHGSPLVYEWTNVPRRHHLKLMMQDASFAAYAKEHVIPLVDRFWKEVAHQGDTDQIKSHLTLIADAAEAYSEQNYTQ